MNFVISHCNSVRITDVLVSGPGDSPNTDVIHITESTNVVLQDTKIGTGDDCVSIVSGSSNIKMKRLYCRPGHGIRIGSLGKDNSTGFVSKVVVDTALLRTLRMASGSRLGRVVMVMFVGYDTKMCRWRMLQTQIMY
ncbi:Polygalacturonase QRT2 [Linum perenne]